MIEVVNLDTRRLVQRRRLGAPGVAREQYCPGDQQRFAQVSQLKSSERTLRTQVGALRRDLAQHELINDIAGASSAMTDVFRLMGSVSASPIAVLIEGETGTGKELVAARAI